MATSCNAASSGAGLRSASSVNAASTAGTRRAEPNTAGLPWRVGQPPPPPPQRIVTPEADTDEQAVAAFDRLTKNLPADFKNLAHAVAVMCQTLMTKVSELSASVECIASEVQELRAEQHEHVDVCRLLEKIRSEHRHELLFSLTSFAAFYGELSARAQRDMRRHLTSAEEQQAFDLLKKIREQDLEGHAVKTEMLKHMPDAVKSIGANGADRVMRLIKLAGREKRERFDKVQTINKAVQKLRKRRATRGGNRRAKRRVADAGDARRRPINNNDDDDDVNDKTPKDNDDGDADDDDENASDDTSFPEITPSQQAVCKIVRLTAVGLSGNTLAPDKVKIKSLGGRRVLATAERVLIDQREKAEAAAARAAEGAPRPADDDGGLRRDGERDDGNEQDGSNTGDRRGGARAPSMRRTQRPTRKPASRAPVVKPTPMFVDLMNTFQTPSFTH